MTKSKRLGQIIFLAPLLISLPLIIDCGGPLEFEQPSCDEELSDPRFLGCFVRDTSSGLIWLVIAEGRCNHLVGGGEGIFDLPFALGGEITGEGEANVWIFLRDVSGRGTTYEDVIYAEDCQASLSASDPLELRIEDCSPHTSWGESLRDMVLWLTPMDECQEM